MLFRLRKPLVIERNKVPNVEGNNGPLFSGGECELLRIGCLKHVEFEGSGDIEPLFA